MPITLAVLDGGIEMELGEPLKAQVAALFPFGFLAFEDQGEAVVQGDFAEVLAWGVAPRRPGPCRSGTVRGAGRG